MSSLFSHVGQGWLSSARSRGGAGWNFASIGGTSVHFHNQSVLCRFPGAYTQKAWTAPAACTIRNTRVSLMGLIPSYFMGITGIPWHSRLAHGLLREKRDAPRVDPITGAFARLRSLRAVDAACLSDCPA